MSKKQKNIFEMFTTQTVQTNFNALNARRFPILGNNVSRNGIKEILARSQDDDDGEGNSNGEFFPKDGSPFRKRLAKKIRDENISLASYAARIDDTSRVNSDQGLIRTDHYSPRHSFCSNSRFHRRSIICPISNFFARFSFFGQKIIDFMVQGLRRVFEIDSEAKILINEMSVIISSIDSRNHLVTSRLEEKVRCLTEELCQTRKSQEKFVSELNKRFNELHENANKSAENLRSEIKMLEKELENLKVSHGPFSVPSPPPPPPPPPPLLLFQPICSLKNSSKSLLLKKIVKDTPKGPVVTAEDLKKVVLRKLPQISEDSPKHKDQSQKADPSLEMLRSVKLRSVQQLCEAAKNYPPPDVTFMQLLNSSQCKIASPVQVARNH